MALTSGPQPTLTDSATLSLGSSPTGTITFTLFAPGGVTPIDTETVTVNGNGTYNTPTGFTLPGVGAVTGTYQWHATYSGDANNNPSSSSSEMEVVLPASPTVTGTPSPAAVTLGTSPVTLTDMAVLSGGYNPTGTITFNLTGPGGGTVDTETVTVSGNGTYTTPTGFTLPTTGTVTGTYQWHVTYSGDADNNGTTVTGGSPVVSPASPTLATTPGPTVNLGTGARMSDSATLSGGYFPSGTLTFMLLNPGNAVVDSETVTVTGNGTYTTPTGFFPTTTAGTYQWRVSYTGDGNNNTVSSPAGSEPEIVQQVHLTITAPVTATAGVAFNFTVTALDPLGNVVTSYSGTVRFTSTDPAATLPANSTLTNGTGTFSATLKTAGTQTITGTDTVAASITGSIPITVTPAAATHFTVSTPATTTEGSAFNFTVTALDPFNNVATGYAGTVRFTSSDPNATLPANSTLTNGVRTFSATFRSAGNQTITATDTVNASITGTSNATADAMPPPATPIPPTVWLASMGIAVLALWRRRRSAA